MDIHRHGSAVPLAARSGDGTWPKSIAYFRGRDPERAEIQAMRDQLVRHCETNQLYLTRIFHDLDVDPARLDYPSFEEVMDCAAHPDTHAVILADLEWWREPSRILGTLAESLIVGTGIRVHCLVDPRMFTLAGMSPPQ